MMKNKEQKNAERRAYVYTGMLLVVGVVLIGLTGCANVTEWRKTVTEDQVNKVKTTEIYYLEDSSFTIGTKGLGTYELIHLEGIGL